MKVTGVVVNPLRTNGKLKAMATVTLDNILTLRGLKVSSGAKGMCVAMPSKPDKKDPTKYWDDVTIVDSRKEGTPGNKLSQEIQTAVLNSYQGAQEKKAPPTEDFNQIKDDTAVPF